MNFKERRIVWAVDPFATSLQAQREAAWALKGLTRGRPAIIQPVYLYSPLTSGSPFSLPDELLEQVRLEAEDAMEQILRRVALEGVRPLHLISKPVPSLREGVQEVLRYASETGTQLIAVGTKAQKGPKRWFMGSFAETLADHSDIPLLVLNPDWNRRADFSQILFATDFSKESHVAFSRILKLAHQQSARITVFHKVNWALGTVFETAWVAMPYYQSAFEDQLRIAHLEADRWVKEAKAAGVRADAHIDSKSTHSVADAILAYSKRHSCLIALASHSGPYEKVLFGSTTRRVLRVARDPVWVVHPVQRSVEHRTPVKRPRPDAVKTGPRPKREVVEARRIR